MCRPIIGVLAVIAFTLAAFTRSAGAQSAGDYQENLRAWQQQQQTWNQQLADQRMNMQRAQWYFVGFLLGMAALAIGSTIASRRRYRQALAKYEKYLGVMEQKEERLIKILESIDRRLGDGT